jgi:hypothetical protein
MRQIEQIRKKKTFGIIFTEDEEERISYCPRCKKQWYLSILNERIYLPDQPIPSDNDPLKQRHDCGTIVPIYEAKKESKLQDFVETTSNPFDQGKSITGIGNTGIGNKLIKTPAPGTVNKIGE